MKKGEHAELLRQGAKAAARGDERHTNPLLHTANRPTHTGESVEDWSFRRDAWHAGFEFERRRAR